MSGGGSAISKIILRVRTQVGTWRLENVSLSDTIAQVKSRLEAEHLTEFLDKPISKYPGGKDVLPLTSTVGSLGLRNGDMIYASVNEEKTGVHETTHTARYIKDGNIVAKEYSQGSQNGFRPGMMALKSMKMQWTLNDFISLDEQFVYRMKNPDKSFCTKVSVNEDSQINFAHYMQIFEFRKIRVGYCYGRFEADNSVRVEYIYEPPQESTDLSFIVHDDPYADRVTALSDMLGMKKVGWILAHPPREKGFQLSGREILFTAEQQLECANGVEDTPFVTVKVTLTDDGNLNVDAFQVTKQCMEMVAEGVLAVSPNLGSTLVNPTFTAIAEGREVKEIENNLFLSNVPIFKHPSDKFRSTFPRANREMEIQTREDLKKQLQQ